MAVLLGEVGPNGKAGISQGEKIAMSSSTCIVRPDAP